MVASKEKKSPCFCKFFLPGVTDQYLRIPSDFIKHLNRGCHQTVSVRGPSGNVRHLHLVEDAKGLLFQDGWKEFARENCLEVGYFLVFRYDGDSCFTMQVFDTSGCSNGDLLVAKSSRESSSVSAEEAAGPLVSQLKGFPVHHKQFGQQTGGSRPVSLRKQVKGSSCMVEQNQPAKWDLEKERRVQSIKRRLMSTYLKSQLNPYESSQAKQKDHQMEVCMRIGRSFISQRKNVTLEERLRAVDQAKSLKLQNPSAVVVMRAPYVYYGFALALPNKFTRSLLPRRNFLMTVWDPTGKKWNIRYLGERRYGSLSAGWRQFSHHNNLEEGDACVFELIENYVLRVHIFRVVEEITPLINNAVRKDK